MIINPQTMSALYTGFQKAFQKGFQSTETYWEKIATQVKSKTAQEQYTWLGQFPNLREWVGDRHLKELSAHNYSILNKKYESTIAVSKDNIEDDSYGVYGPLFKEMGHAAKRHPDELIFNLLKDGYKKKCYDGKAYFANNHPVGGDIASNRQDGKGAPWFLLDTTRALKPIIFQKRKEYALEKVTTGENESVFMRAEYRYGVDARCNVGYGFWQQAYASKATLNKDNFNKAMESMLSLKNDEGNPLGIRPSLLVVGPSLRGAALEVIKAERLQDGSTNVNKDAVELAIVPWI